jgi:hypothetical protein
MKTVYHTTIRLQNRADEREGNADEYGHLYWSAPDKWTLSDPTGTVDDLERYPNDGSPWPGEAAPSA